MQFLVMTGILKSNRFPKDGVIGRGRSRGVWLEVDRLEAKENYSEKNCVLSCYFCNNDKSDVFNGAQYHEFSTNRTQFLRELIQAHSGGSI